jgi:cystathionine beta-lyase
MYGASGTPTAFALEDAINEIEGGERSVLLPTGLAGHCARVLVAAQTRRPRAVG